MNRNILILSIAIILAGIIFGGFYYVSEVNKQKSIEKQQQVELQVKINADQVQQDAIKQAEENKTSALNLCLSEVKSEYDSDMNHYWNSWTKTYNVVVPSSPVGLALADKLKNNQDTCIKQYK